ncbi:MAG: CPBP family intramembrane metalloprotease [Anaerolineae bacterium]|nr:CPBP family intramembrane metalloprotease [Anaerolineae bacterium]
MSQRPARPSLGLRILRFLITRIVLGSILLGLGMTLGQMLIASLLQSFALASPEWVNILVAVGLSLSLYTLFVRMVEGRPATELSLRHGGEFVQGLAPGALVFSAVVGILWLLGVYRVLGSNALSVLAQSLAIGLIPGFVEEIFFRGVLYRIIEESLGTWIALIITSVLFGFAHAGNPNASLFSSVAIAIEAGLMLGIGYTLTRRLWLSIGIHTAWNFVQGGVYGVNVSGIDVPGVLVSELVGPAWLSGGGFGAEASVVAVLVCLALFAVLLRQTYRRGRLVLPFWARQRV